MSDEELEELEEKLAIAIEALNIIMKNNFTGINNHAQGTALVALDKIRNV